MTIDARNENLLQFADFQLDLTGPELRRDGRVVPLRPKSLALISHLAQRPGQLVRKEELVDAIWGSTAVTDATLARTLFDAREALGDDSREPRFIETVHRLGFRFLGLPDRPSRQPDAQATPAASSSRLVGRRRELARLAELRALADAGQRQVVFLAGEPGIGKTTLLDAFLAEAAVPSTRAAHAPNGDAGALVARGQCIEHYGTAEAYLPLLDALGELSRGFASDAVVPVLRRMAPTWLAQLPWLIEEDDRAGLDRELRGVTSARMLRELAQALETLTQQRLLVLALEDLHWSDFATADFLSFLARRTNPSRLLVMVSYRPVDAILSENPIRSVHHELQRQGRCHGINLEPLPADDVGELVARRFDAAPFAGELATVVHRRTEGHPLFVVGMLEDLVSQGRIASASGGWQLGGRIADIEGSVPEGLQQMVHTQVDRLGEDERAVVEAASVVGASFSSAAVAAALESDLVEVEERCEAMARSGIFLDRGGIAAWPDGTSASSYTFRHSLYCDALYKSIPTARRRQLHGRVGRRLENGHASDLASAAVALGRHFEEAGDASRAARHLRQAAEVAARRGAPREALALIARTRAQLAQLPPGLERTVEELMVEIAAGPALAAIEGYASLEVERIFARAREHCRALGDGSQLFPVLWGLWSFSCVRGRIEEALGMAREVYALAEASGDPEMIIEGHHAMWVTTFWRGDAGECGRHLDAALALYDRGMHHSHVMMYGQDPGVVAYAYRCLVRQAQGREHEADADSIEAMDLGRALGHHVSSIFGVGFRGWMFMERGQASLCRPLAEEVFETATTHGLAFWQAHSTWIVSRALAATDPVAGIAGMQGAVEALRAMGARMGIPGYLATLARVVLESGDAPGARRLVDEAWEIGTETGEWLGRAELLRLRGDLELTGPRSPDAAARAADCYREAIAVAHRQEATRLELLSALDLARLWRDGSQGGDAVALLSPIVERLPADGSSAELAEARSYLRG